MQGIGPNAGQFVLWEPDENGVQKCHPVGSEVDVILRQVENVELNLLLKGFRYQFELVLDDHFTTDNLVTFTVDIRDDAGQLCIHKFNGPAWGQKHTLGLRKFQIDARNAGHSLTINGWLWDNKLIRAKDIAV